MTSCRLRDNRGSWCTVSLHILVYEKLEDRPDINDHVFEGVFFTVRRLIEVLFKGTSIASGRLDLLDLLTIHLKKFQQIATDELNDIGME